MDMSNQICAVVTMIVSISIVVGTQYREANHGLPPGTADWQYAMEYTDVFGVVFRGNYNFLSVDPTTLKVSAQGHVYHHGRQPTDPYTIFYRSRKRDGNILLRHMTNLDRYLCLNDEKRVNLMELDDRACTFRLLAVGQQGSSDVYYHPYSNCTISLSVNSGKPKINCFPAPPYRPPKSVVFDRVRPRIETILQFTTLYSDVFPDLDDSSKIANFTHQKTSTRSKVYLVDWQTGETRREYFRFPNSFSFLKQLEFAEFDLIPPYMEERAATLREKTQPTESSSAAATTEISSDLPEIFKPSIFGFDWTSLEVEELSEWERMMKELNEKIEQNLPPGI